MNINKENPVFVFVYGTLKKGHSGSYCFGNSEYMGEAVTETKFIMSSKAHGFPRTKRDDQGSYIKGEVFKVTDPSVLGSLDSYEGYPSFYDREKETVHFKDGQIEVDIYVSKDAADIFDHSGVQLCEPDENNIVVWA